MLLILATSTAIADSGLFVLLGAQNANKMSPYVSGCNDYGNCPSGTYRYSTGNPSGRFLTLGDAFIKVNNNNGQPKYWLLNVAEAWSNSVSFSYGNYQYHGYWDQYQRGVFGAGYARLYSGNVKGIIFDVTNDCYNVTCSSATKNALYATIQNIINYATSQGQKSIVIKYPTSGMAYDAVFVSEFNAHNWTGNVVTANIYGSATTNPSYSGMMLSESSLTSAASALQSALSVAGFVSNF